MSVTELPSVTVIVLNYNGLEHLEDCFSSLTQVDYPAERLELMLVDNGSTDQSVEYVRTHYPQVRIVRSEENLGFAAGNNLGAREAQGEYVAFLNNDMRVHPNWIKGLLEPITVAGQDVVCTSAKILGWDGTTIDFAGGMANFYGRAFQRGFMEDARAADYTTIEPIFFACGGSMLVHRQTFLDTGGFDPDYFIYYEDLDFSWRLWITGYQVMFAPNAIVYHRHHATMDKVSAHQKQVLYDRNSLYTIVKNYEKGNLEKILPVAVLSLIKRFIARSVALGELDVESFRLWTASPDKSDHQKLSKSSLSAIVALDDFIEHLPQLMRKRREVQNHRQRSDKEVFDLFRHPFKYPWVSEPFAGVHAQAQSKLMRAFDVGPIFRHVPKRVLVVSSDILPYPGLPTTGAGLRTWGLGQGLIGRGHEVIFAMPRAALEHAPELPEEATEFAWEPASVTQTIQAAQADVVVVCNWPVLDFVNTENLPIPVVLDQAGPHLLEREYQNFGTREDNSRRKLNAFRKADFFNCSGQKQFAYFLPWLEEAGWSEQERRELTGVIPFSVPPDLPERYPHDELTFVYGGVFLPWQDPSMGLLALIQMLEHQNRGKLLFFGGRHPVYPVDTGTFDSLLAQLKTSPRVVASGIVPYDDLIAEYTRAHVAVDLMKRNAERELAFTTRTVVYLWCGLPVIYNDYSELSEYIRRYDAGWTMDPEDRETIDRVIQEILSNPDIVTQKSENAQRLVRECLTWDETISPLDDFIREPTIRHRSLPTRSSARRAGAHLINEAIFHYKHGGLVTLSRESLAFIRRQLQHIFG